ncbi:TIGR04283 family arsenosugar biosynthesis glycosyltransferase [Marivirga arenosa]|uniref:TIGR04283 family arsenosugar biosynthesis glycosyltransferase n=1 Tax=Marivirga arenosa TaxID=3059076 RepID=A0AA49GFV3_9BACT|nr:TIGR04283 family arsenosugar biosynthesis glycosyltransferase [Marivirga sp. ABR2-2]WKK87428.1 TIGR04283 family arsenosugar biosynthesis glycosyltransferase [Marivirga sp. ABR2-2]
MSHTQNNKISVIIPTLNEAENISTLIQHLKANSGHSDIEIIVSDAKSEDHTAEIASKLGVITISTKKASRAHQMNEGAKIAKGDILYFVHADAKPPKSFVQDIQQSVHSGNDFGCYRFKFDSKSPFLAVNSWFTRFKVLWCRGGDQTLFIKKSVFDQNHGFDEKYVLMEDFELIKRIWKKHQFGIIPKSVLVSARKYKYNSYWRVNLVNLKIFRMFMKGVEPQILKKKYFQLLKHPKDNKVS